MRIIFNCWEQYEIKAQYYFYYVASGIFDDPTVDCRETIVSSSSFLINGVSFTVKPENDDLTPESVLVDFIRDKAGLTGTKYTCREGGCGACVVSVKSKDPSSNVEIVRAVNSCLTPVFTCDGWDISTIERLGNQKDGYHPIQQRLVEFNGTQCGFCSPGMVMNMYSLTKSKRAFKAEVVEESFDGNICRCTGYRPIQDAFKSFAIDGATTLCADYSDCESPTRDFEDSTIYFTSSNGEVWVKVTRLQTAFTYMNRFLLEGKKYRIVAGDTAKGVYKNDGPYDAFIDISSIPELSRSSIDDSGVFIGGGVTLSRAIDFLKNTSTIEGYEYLAEISKHMKRVANTPIRNVGTIAGNLMIKHNHREFSSDLFVIFEAVGAKISISSKPYLTSQYSPAEFLTLNMNSKLIIRIQFYKKSSGYKFRSYKVAHRYQNAHAYINAAFSFNIYGRRNFKVLEKPNIVYGGVNNSFIHAVRTEQFLQGRNLNSLNTLEGAIKALNEEVEPDYRPPEPHPEYRKFLTKSLFYKTILSILGVRATSAVRSGGSSIKRDLMSGKQTYEKNPSPEDSPLHQALPKLEASVQVSGEAEYIDDIQHQRGELFGAFVLTTVAKATLESVDASEALKMPGVVAFIQAKDIPGQNNYLSFGFDVLIEPELIFVEDKITYAGQPIGMILAVSRDIAFQATKKVIVSYDNIQKPELDIEELVKKYEMDGTLNDHIYETITTDGNGETPSRIITGEFRIGSQYHMHMENQSCLVVPTENGIDVFSSTQWMDQLQATVATTLNIPNNQINITVRRIGGAFGAKITKAALFVTAAAVGAYVTRKPVRVITDLETNMLMVGKRLPYFVLYKVGVNENGEILSLVADYFCDCGSTRNEPTSTFAVDYIQNAYRALGWKISPGWVKTNTPPNTYTRGPGNSQGTAIIEYIMEHISHVLGKDPMEVRAANYVQEGDIMLHPRNQFEGINPIPELIEQLKMTSDYERRLQHVKIFNKANRWKKRGLAFSAIKFPVELYDSRFPVFISIYHQDGTVAVSHGGIDMGQGINTKVAQTVAYELKIPLSKIQIKPPNNLTAANGYTSASSVTSELCCYAALRACKMLNDRIAPIKELYPNLTWEALIQKCFEELIDLSASYLYKLTDPVMVYNTWGLIFTEVEIDILTGEYKIVRVDLIEDAGKSLNPSIDLGQIEGGFVMGIGLWTTESIIHDVNTGQLLTKNSWNYFPPEPKDIPEDFRVTILKNAPNPFGVLSSKTTGEPPLHLGVSVLFALRKAIAAARKDVGNTDWFRIDGPVLPEDIVRHSLVNTAQFYF